MMEKYGEFHTAVKLVGFVSGMLAQMRIPILLEKSREVEKEAEAMIPGLPKEEIAKLRRLRESLEAALPLYEHGMRMSKDLGE